MKRELWKSFRDFSFVNLLVIILFIIKEIIFEDIGLGSVVFIFLAYFLSFFGLSLIEKKKEFAKQETSE